MLNQPMFNPETGALKDHSGSADGTTLEVRIPWLLMNFRDPSQKEVTTDIIANKSIYKSEFIKDIGLGVLFVDKDRQTVQAFPQSGNGAVARYTWENWDRFETTPRLKKSYYVFQNSFATMK